MPRLCGIVSDDASEAKRLATAMAEAMCHNGRDVARVWSLPGFAVGLVGLPAEKVDGSFHEENGRAAVVCGTVYDEPGVLARFSADGAPGLAGLNGRYVCCVWEDAERGLSIANDLLGLRPLYYWTDGRVLLFSSELKAILCHPGVRTVLDERSMAEFLTMGFPLEDRTLLRDVRHLPEGSVLSFRDGRVRCEKVASFRFTRERWDRKPAELAEEACQLIRRAVETRLARSPSALMTLSGGIDSRVLAATAAELGIPFRALTYGRRHCEETHLAQRVARALRVEFDFVPLPDDFMWRRLEQGIDVLDAPVDCQNLHWLLVSEQGRGDGETAVCGNTGDAPVGHGGMCAAVRWVRSEHEAFDNLYRTFQIGGPGLHDWDLRDVLRPSVYCHVAGAARETCERVFLSAPAEETYQRCTYLWLIARDRRLISHMPLAYELGLPTVAPFTDREYLRFAFTLPDHAVWRKEIYRWVLAQHFPAMARISSTTFGPPVVESAGARFVRRVWKHVGRRCLRLASFGRLYGADYPFYARHSHALRTDSRRVLDRLAGASDFLDQYFNVAAIQKLVQEHLSRRRDHGTKLCGLATLAEWHARLIESRPSHSN